MKREFFILLTLITVTVAVFNKSFTNFFVQDDFVLIQEFSGGNLILDIANAFGPPSVTHWRPIHNLYFLVTGNLFNKNLIAYHIATYLIHIMSAFLIYRISYIFYKNLMASVAFSIVYATHPAFFISFFWVSGGATTIGFFLLVSSFYTYLIGKWRISISLYFASMLASEAMLFGVFIFVAHRFFLSKEKARDNYWLKTSIVSLIFVVLRFVLFKSVSVANDYQLKVGFETFSALKYYILRILAFPDTSINLIWVLLLMFWAGLSLYSIRKFAMVKTLSGIPFCIIVIISGLLPFILLPDHLSAHFINISIFGFCLLLSHLLSKAKPIILVSTAVIFGLLSAASVNSMTENSWVVNRSKIAKAHIRSIERLNPPGDYTIVFSDDSISSSYEAYISLGTGRALDFWFGDKNYKSCFSAFEICDIKP